MVKGERHFDFWVTYYGQGEMRYKNMADYYCVRKGSKWQNLYDVFKRWPEIIRQYESIFVTDDDIIISTEQINRLFEIRKQFDLWLCQPAFDLRGKISHPITEIKPQYFMRYTNFVENTCPLFRTDKLEQFMEVYDPSLCAGGVDYWYMDVLKQNPFSSRRVSVIDAIRCINPFDFTKGGEREYEKIDKVPWEETKKTLAPRYGIKSHLEPHKEFGFVYNWKISDYVSAVGYLLTIFAIRLKKFILRVLAYWH
mgnify:CR=1 FL=1